LLDKYSINTPTIIYYETTREKADRRGQKIIDLLSEGKDIALVTDAGTPGISDPGQFLISKVIARNIEVIPIPGPSAFVSALSISGFNDPACHFVPFLPKKKGRQTMLNFLKNLEATIVFYESPQRIGKTLFDLSSFFEVERPIVICRELTKIFEEAYRGSIAEALEKFSNEIVKGEFVIVIKGYEKSKDFSKRPLKGL
jgi:16S rRNA (cytidine1402-2'-O)-methyltransferase